MSHLYIFIDCVLVKEAILSTNSFLSDSFLLGQLMAQHHVFFMKFPRFSILAKDTWQFNIRKWQCVWWGPSAWEHWMSSLWGNWSDRGQPPRPVAPMEEFCPVVALTYLDDNFLHHPLNWHYLLHCIWHCLSQVYLSVFPSCEWCLLDRR